VWHFATLTVALECGSLLPLYPPQVAAGVSTEGMQGEAPRSNSASPQVRKVAASCRTPKMKKVWHFATLADLSPRPPLRFSQGRLPRFSLAIAG